MNPPPMPSNSDFDDDQPVKQEMLLVYDADGYMLKAMPRAEIRAESPRTSWVGVVTACIIGSDGRILCTRRAAQAPSNPGKWQASVANYVRGGHTFAEAISAELRDILGLPADSGKVHLVERANDPKTLTHAGFYIFPFAGKSEDLKLFEPAVAEVRWMTLDEIRDAVQSDSGSWTGPLSPRHEPAIRTWIADGGRPRNGRK